MKNHHRGRLRAVILGAAVVFAATTAVADWSHDPLENDLVADGALDQYRPRIVSDGQGGALIAYIDVGGSIPTVKVKRVDAGGNMVWGSTGVVAHQSFGFLTDITMISDGAGGGFLAIQDSHDSVYYHSYVQHVTASGDAEWGTVGLNAAIGVSAGQEQSTLCLDGLGGVVVAYMDGRAGNLDIYGQRFDGTGARLWTNGGKALCTVADSQYQPSAVYDESNGFYVAWRDSRNLGSSGPDIYTNRYDMAGNTLWIANGYRTCGAADTQDSPKAIPDGMGGVIVAWLDSRLYGTTSVDIYAQRYIQDGNRMWPFDGADVCTEEGASGQMDIAPDGFGGAYLAWTDSRADSYTGTTIYVQAVAADGALRWAAGGAIAGGGAGNQFYPRVILTSDGNAAFFWADERNGYDDVYAQMYRYDGGRLCSYYGQPVSNGPFNQYSVAGAADSRGGIIVAFEDNSSGLDFAVSMQRLDRTGVLGDPAAVITRLIDHPLDQGGQMLLDWTPSWLDGFQQPGIYRYSLWRRFPGGSAPGAMVLPPATDKGLSTEDLVAMQKAGWTYIDEVLPQQFAEYGFVVPTFADSTGAGTPLTEYMVLTETGGGYSESNIVGGWSVDNLAPGAPLALAAELVGVDASLAWNASGYHDEDLLQYNLYRAQTPGVVPGPLTFVASSPDTMAVDPALPSGDWYYVVTAVDVHGNEGEPSNEVMVLSASTVTDSGIPSVAAIRGAYPNPFNPATTIRYAVPATGHARLTVYDLRGQKIATLVDRVTTAGHHSAAWNGQGADGRQVPSGVYFARLETAGAQATSKLVLAK